MAEVGAQVVQSNNDVNDPLLDRVLVPATGGGDDDMQIDTIEVAVVADTGTRDAGAREPPDDAELVPKKKKKRGRSYIRAQNALLDNMSKCGARYQEKFPEAQLMLFCRFPNKTSGCEVTC